jgi:hypothetical protein
MPDRHFELPAHPSLEYYRKQAKHLQHSYEAGDAAARARVAEALGDRAAERFLLSHAQFVLAQEHGFRTRAEFRAHIQSRSSTEDRPVSPPAGDGAGHVCLDVHPHAAIRAMAGDTHKRTSRTHKPCAAESGLLMIKAAPLRSAARRCPRRALA